MFYLKNFPNLQPIASSLQSASPAALHDIVGPVPFFPYTTTQLGVAALILVVIIGLIIGIIWKKHHQRPLTPTESALQALAEMKKGLMLGDDHEFGIGVSTLLRNYLAEVLGLAAPRQTTEEFLKSLQSKQSFSASQQEALSNFLCQSDVLKFAQGIAGAQERLALIDAAESLIQKREESQG